jgi:hypothetical protein
VEWDLFGFAQALFMPFFPQRLTDLHMLVAFPHQVLAGKEQVRITLTDLSAPTTKAWLDMIMAEPEELASTIRLGEPPKIVGSDPRLLVYFNHKPPRGADWHEESTAVPVTCPPLFLARPCTVAVSAKIGDTERRIGSFDCVHVVPPPLSPGEILAIRSRPDAAKLLKIRLGCTKCEGQLWLGKYLDKEGANTKALDGCVVLEEAPDDWVCSCGSVKVPLTYLKQGIHDLFRHGTARAPDEIRFTPLYESGAVASILHDYQELINGDPCEESVQSFLEKHPIVWNFIAPKRILPKPPVLTKKKADFAILTSNRILYLVEIEKPRTRLTTASGGMHSQLQAGLNQIRDWRVVVQDFRGAFLSQIDIPEGEVDDIRYILVAGLAHRTPQVPLMTLRRSSLDDHVHWYTFDDLAAFLRSTECELRRL